MSNSILPALGACVVFTIDPVASLDPETLEDAEAVEACKGLVSNQYAGIVVERSGLYQPWDPYNGCTVEFILQGTPKSYPDKFMEASMSVPIHPMTIENHPSGRVPLQPSNPLPWDDCYISTFWSASVRSPTLFSETEPACALDLDELNRHERFLFSDVARHEALCMDNGIDQRALFPIGKDPLSNPDSACVAEEPTGDLRDEKAAVVVELDIFSNPALQAMITVNFSNDLSTITELNDPADYFKEIAEIARIQNEAKPRLAEARAHAIKEAAKLNAEYDERTLDMLAARLPTQGSPGRVSRLTSKVKKRVARIVRPVLRLLCPTRIFA
ncbi:hypothetical protein B0H15DRAFT_962715 [Mycena belliarum]|uniref:Uncharacterized protein n=1 Tax=Mycena belliarum TaxID=1033014 RepID=A0AAD6UA12_9AGAR|nr:hypothetical protein B0H15DRAFT_962715 [Mycena belliae]